MRSKRVTSSTKLSESVLKPIWWISGISGYGEMMTIPMLLQKNRCLIQIWNPVFHGYLDLFPDFYLAGFSEAVWKEDIQNFFISGAAEKVLIILRNSKNWLLDFFLLQLIGNYFVVEVIKSLFLAEWCFYFEQSQKGFFTCFMALSPEIRSKWHK